MTHLFLEYHCLSELALLRATYGTLDELCHLLGPLLSPIQNGSNMGRCVKG
jgi:hypothetical protein